MVNLPRKTVVSLRGISTIELKETIRKSKLDFTVSKLESLVLEVAQISGNDNPVYYLDEFLNDVKGFDDLEFQQTFIQNLYSLIKANSAKFWNNDHKKKIKEWLLKNTGNMIIPSLEELWKISDNEAEGEKEYTDKNDLIKSTIVAYLKPFEERLTESHYYYLIEYLLEYFKTNHFPNITGTIDFKRVNKKKVGWALNQIFRALKTENEALPFEYLNFAKKHISIFKKDDVRKSDYLSSNLYKYFTTKTK